MKEIMDWDICKKEYIRKVNPDKEKINSILKMCSVRLKFVEKQEVDDEIASLITEDYYEIIKELLTALLLNRGLKSNNHECLISYFRKEYSKYEYETNIIHELKDIRNRITYDGIFVDKKYLMKNKLEFKHIINLLKDLVDKDE